MEREIRVKRIRGGGETPDGTGGSRPVAVYLIDAPIKCGAGRQFDRQGETRGVEAPEILRRGKGGGGGHRRGGGPEKEILAVARADRCPLERRLESPMG